MDKEIDKIKSVELSSVKDTSVDSIALSSFSNDHDNFFDDNKPFEIDLFEKDKIKLELPSIPERKFSSCRYDVFSMEDYYLSCPVIPTSSTNIISANIISQDDLDYEFANFGDDISFRGISLAGLDFKKRLLSRVIFRECDLSNCNFSSCDLSHAHFIDCKCDGANFHNTNCSSVWFYSCGLKGCNFSLANLVECYFDRSFLDNRDFKGVSFTYHNLFKPNSLPKGFYRITMNSVYLRDFIIDLPNDVIYLYNHVTLHGPNLLGKLKKAIFDDISDVDNSSPFYQNEANVTYDIIEKLYLGIGKSDYIKDEKNSSSDSSDVTGSDDVIEDEGDNLARLRPKSELGNFESTPVIDKKIVFTVSLILLFIFIVSYFYALFNDAPKGGF